MVPRMTHMKHILSRRSLLLSGAASLGLAACSINSTSESADADNADNEDRYAGSEWRQLTEEDWRARLTEAAFAVMREEGTERPFTSDLNKEARTGTYHCAGCDLALFSSDTKFDSGTGWPSFHDVLPGAMGTKADRKLIYVRTEYHCARCLGHQGHVFDDGPDPTGLRYCNNGVALAFKPA
jgi:peptide-methionine (R)-S-oxide reductase